MTTRTARPSDSDMVREACGSHPPHPGSPLCRCERIAAAIRTAVTDESAKWQDVFDAMYPSEVTTVGDKLCHEYFGQECICLPGKGHRAPLVAASERVHEFDTKFAEQLKEFGTIERLVDGYREAKMELRASQARVGRLVEAARSLTRAVSGLMGVWEMEIRAIAGNTNYAVVQHWLEQVREALAAAEPSGGAPGCDTCWFGDRCLDGKIQNGTLACNCPCHEPAPAPEGAHRCGADTCRCRCVTADENANEFNCADCDRETWDDDYVGRYAPAPDAPGAAREEGT